MVDMALEIVKPLMDTSTMLCNTRTPRTDNSAATKRLREGLSRIHNTRQAVLDATHTSAQTQLAVCGELKRLVSETTAETKVAAQDLIEELVALDHVKNDCEDRLKFSPTTKRIKLFLDELLLTAKADKDWGKLYECPAPDQTVAMSCIISGGRDLTQQEVDSVAAYLCDVHGFSPQYLLNRQALYQTMGSKDQSMVIRRHMDAFEGLQKSESLDGPRMLSVEQWTDAEEASAEVSDSRPQVAKSYVDEFE